MSPEEVIAQLGEPTLDEPSLNRRIDFVYTYQGRRPATNQKIEGSSFLQRRGDHIEHARLSVHCPAFKITPCGALFCAQL